MTAPDTFAPSVAAPLETDAGRITPGAPGQRRAGRFKIEAVTPATFSTHRAAAIRHGFDAHPLMQLPELLALAKEMQPLGGCRFIEPGTTEASEFLHADRRHDGMGIDEVFRRIEEPGSWVALYNIENIPRYRDFLVEVIDAARHLVEPEQPEIFLVTGFVFISSPPSVTPFHIDRENNFWLQIRGRKFLSLWDRTDRAVVPARDVEEFIVHRNLDGVRLTDAARPRAQEFDNGPGDGMYFPSTSPHMTRTTTDWVQPGDGVSISIGINFYTNVTRHDALVYQANRMIRRLGMAPTPPGRSAWRDALKQPLGRLAIKWLEWRLGAYVVPPGGR